ncbi:hypothetical protein L0222_03230 [bacterium]|nr:hypothetical protein [bacterium]
MEPTITDTLSAVLMLREAHVNRLCMLHSSTFYNLHYPSFLIFLLGVVAAITIASFPFFRDENCR